MNALLLAVVLAAIAPIPDGAQEHDAERAEAVSDEAAAAARGVCTGLRALDPARIQEQLATGFTASGLGDAPLDAPKFEAALFARAQPAAVIRRCTFKPFQFQTNAAHDRAVARLWLNLGGTERSGQRFADHGDVLAELVRVDGKLRFRALELQPRTWTTGGAPRFANVTHAIGMDDTFDPRFSIASVFGGLDSGGLSVGDFDGDGKLDVYVVHEGKSFLYRNDGNGHFTDVAQKAGVTNSGGNGRMAIFADLDNDGDLDLFVTNKATKKNPRGNHLYRNDGNGHFTDVTKSSGVGQAGPYMGVAAADVDGDGLIDLYVAAYQDKAVMPKPMLDAHNGRPNLLLHNEGHLHFKNVAAQAGVDGKEWSYQPTFADLDGDHKPDLVVVNDWGASKLYKNVSTPGHPKFLDVSEQAGLRADPGNGMGVDVGDVDGDGKPDIHLSKMYSTAGNRLLSQALEGNPHWLEVARTAARGNSLFHNDGDMHFTEVGDAAGIRRAGWAWSCQLADVDDDGDLDLYVANGFHTGAREDEL